MPIPAFDPERLAAALGRLRPRQRIAFGAACCVRMLPSYARFKEETGWGIDSPLKRAVDLCWHACGNRQPDRGELRRLLEECESSAPSSEDFQSLYTSAAQDAAFAICSMIDYLLEERISALVRAGQYPTDSLDLLIQEMTNQDPLDPDLEEKILLHPLMQQELQRQARDLQELQSMDFDDGYSLQEFRRRGDGEDLLSLVT